MMRIVPRIYPGQRFTSSEKRDPLAAHKVQPKSIQSRDVKRQANSMDSRVQTQKEDNRGFLSRMLNLPPKTAALEDSIPNVLKDPNERRFIKENYDFYNNLVIYDFPRLPPVEHKQLKHVKTEYHGVTEAGFKEDTLWSPVFRMPAIRSLRAVGRLKVYLTAVSSCFIIREINNLFTHGVSYDLFPPLSLATLTFGSLIYTGSLLNKLVVQIYASEDLRYLRFSRFTFYARRRDIIVPIDNVRPLTETNPTMRMPYYNLEFIKPKELDLENDYHEFYDLRLRILVYFGGIRDRELFEQVLGKLLRNKIGA